MEVTFHCERGEDGERSVANAERAFGEGHCTNTDSWTAEGRPWRDGICVARAEASCPGCAEVGTAVSSQTVFIVPDLPEELA